MRETTLVSRSGTAMRCEVCQWRCALADGDVGRCRVRRRSGHAVVNHADDMISAATVGPVEDYGFRHFFPDAPVFAVGGWGTPFPNHQDRMHHAEIPSDPSKQRSLDPERLVRFAVERMARGIVWAYNDPIINLEHLTDTIKLARSSSRITGMVTGGFWSRPTLDTIGSYLDGINLILHGFSSNTYRTITGIEEWRGIPAAAEYAVKKWGCHLEITTPIVTGLNDSSTEIEAIAKWIRNTFKGLIPWRIIRANDADTNAANAARAIALNQGLPYVYGSQPTETTHCPGCGWAIIERFKGQIRVVGVHDSHCENCNAEVYVRTSSFKRNKM